IRAIFPRVSEIIQPVVAHDALALKFSNRTGHVTLEARSTGDLPIAGWPATDEERDFSIVSDLQRVKPRSTDTDRNAFDALVAGGYRSILCVRTVAQS